MAAHAEWRSPPRKRKVVNPAGLPAMGAPALPRLHLVLLAALVALPSLAVAQTRTSTSAADAEGTLEAIDFEGLRRVEPAAIRVLLTSRRGRPYRPSAVSEDIRAIYGMGYFD